MTVVIPLLRGPGRGRRAMTASPGPLDVHATAGTSPSRRSAGSGCS